MAASSADLYREDFYAWAYDQAAALRCLAEARPNVDIDFPHLIDEVEALARGERATVLIQLQRLIEHLLKLQISSDTAPHRGWLIAVNDARAELDRHLTPTIRNELAAELPKLCRRACRNASLALRHHGEEHEVGIMTSLCAGFELDQLLDEEWLPRNLHGITDEPL